MHAIRVQYTVQPDFAATNAANIEKVMAVLQANPIPGVQYSAFRKSDGQTFVHLVVATSEEARAKIPQLPEFQAFQNALQASKPISPPETEALDVVASSHAP